MGCLDSVPDVSPEGRARAFEEDLMFKQFDCDNVKSAFFLLNTGDKISEAKALKGWTNLKGKGIPLVLTENGKKARDAAFAKVLADSADSKEEEGGMYVFLLFPFSLIY